MKNIQNNYILRLFFSNHPDYKNIQLAKTKTRNIHYHHCNLFIYEWLVKFLVEVEIDDLRKLML